MALGKIKADTLEHSTSGSVDTKFVVEGSAKSWTYITGDGTPAVTDSFNTASLTDVNTGEVRSNFTNSMNNDDFCFQAFVQENSFFGAIQELTTSSGRIRTSSSAVSVSHNLSAGADVDARSHLVLGDLA